MLRPKFKYFITYRVGDLDARGIGRHYLAVNLPAKLIMVNKPLAHSPIMKDPNFWLDEDECRLFDQLGLCLDGFVLRSVYRDRSFKIECKDRERP